jgi:hypothetical protein
MASSTLGFEAILQLYNDWLAQKAIVDGIQSEIDKTGASIQKLTNDATAATNAGNNAQALAYAEQIRDQQAPYLNQLSTQIVPAKNLLAQKWQAYLDAKGSLSPQEQSAAQTVLDAQTQAAVLATQAQAAAAVEASKAKTASKSFIADNTTYFIIGAALILLVIGYFVTRPKPIPAA